MKNDNLVIDTSGDVFATLAIKDDPNLLIG